MASGYTNWMSSVLGQESVTPDTKVGVSPTFKPKYKTAAEFAKARGQTDFTPEPYKYVEPASTNKRIADYSMVPGGTNAVKYAGLAPAVQVAKTVASEASKTPAQRGAEFATMYAQNNQVVNSAPPSAPVLPSTPIPAVKNVAAVPSSAVTPPAIGQSRDWRKLEVDARTPAIRAAYDQAKLGSMLGRDAALISRAGSYSGPATNAENVIGILNAPKSPYRATNAVENADAKARYQDFMVGSLERGKEAMARWNVPKIVGARPNKDIAAEQNASKARAEQNAQANVAGEREAGVEKFKAEKAAEGMVRAKDYEYNKAMDVQESKNKGAKEAASEKAESGQSRNEVEILKALSSSETADEATKMYALNRLKQLGGIANTEGQAQVPAIGTVKNGYKFKGGNPADKNAWEKA